MVDLSYWWLIRDSFIDAAIICCVYCKPPAAVFHVMHFFAVSCWSIFDQDVAWNKQLSAIICTCNIDEY